MHFEFARTLLCVIYRVNGRKRHANRTILDEAQPSLIWTRALLLSLLTIYYRMTEAKVTY